MSFPSSSWLSNMSFDYRRAVSANKHPKDELLSALQKFIRRGLSKEAAYAAVELELFSALPEAKGLVTNAVNRLRVTLCEEVGIADPLVILAFDRHYRQFEANRAPLGNETRRREAWLSMVQLLVAARKVRVVSWLKNAYLTPYKHSNAVRTFMTAHRDLCPSSTAPSLPRHPYIGIAGDDDRIALRPVADALVSAIERRHVPDGMSALDELILFTKRGGRARKRRVHNHSSNNPMMLLFDLLQQRPGRTPREQRVDEILFDYFWHFRLHPGENWARRSHRDWVIFVTLPLIVHLYPLDFDANVVHWNPHAPTEVRDAYMRNTSLCDSMVFPDYCIDQHTLRGKRAGRDGVHFALEGATVTNEHARLSATPLKQLYIDCKIAACDAVASTDGAKRRRISANDSLTTTVATSSGSSNVTNKRQKTTLPASARSFLDGRLKPSTAALLATLAAAPVAQLITNKHKPMVLLPRDDDAFVYKGPYAWPAKAPLLAHLMFRFAVLATVWHDCVNGPFDLFLTDNGRAVYARMPNVACTPAQAWCARSHEKSTLLTGEQRHVITKDSQGLKEMHTFIDDLGDAAPTSMQRSALVDGIVHFIHRYIIDPSIGDPALRNVLIDDSLRAIGIDMDDTRGRQDVGRSTGDTETLFKLIGGHRWGRSRVAYLSKHVLSDASIRATIVNERIARVTASLEPDGAVEQLISAHGLTGAVSLENMRTRAHRIESALRR